MDTGSLLDAGHLFGSGFKITIFLAMEKNMFLLTPKMGRSGILINIPMVFFVPFEFTLVLSLPQHIKVRSTHYFLVGGHNWGSVKMKWAFLTIPFLFG